MLEHPFEPGTNVPPLRQLCLRRIYRTEPRRPSSGVKRERVQGEKYQGCPQTDQPSWHVSGAWSRGLSRWSWLLWGLQRRLQPSRRIPRRLPWPGSGRIQPLLSRLGNPFSRLAALLPLGEPPGLPGTPALVWLACRMVTKRGPRPVEGVTVVGSLSLCFFPFFLVCYFRAMGVIR